MEAQSQILSRNESTPDHAAPSIKTTLFVPCERRMVPETASCALSASRNCTNALSTAAPARSVRSDPQQQRTVRQQAAEHQGENEGCQGHPASLFAEELFDMFGVWSCSVGGEVEKVRVCTLWRFDFKLETPACRSV